MFQLKSFIKYLYQCFATIQALVSLPYVVFSVMYFCNQAPNSLGGHSDQFSLHLSHQGNREISLST